MKNYIKASPTHSHQQKSGKDRWEGTRPKETESCLLVLLLSCFKEHFCILNDNSWDVKGHSKLVYWLSKPFYVVSGISRLTAPKPWQFLTVSRCTVYHWGKVTDSILSLYKQWATANLQTLWNVQAPARPFRLLPVIHYEGFCFLHLKCY